MVDYIFELDTVFHALADPTRRDIVNRLHGEELKVGEVARPYALSLAAVSKHLKVLERAQLIVKRKVGTVCYVSLNPGTLERLVEYLQNK